MSQHYDYNHLQEVDAELNFKQYSKIYLLGAYKGPESCTPLPHCWYHQLGLNQSMRTSHFYVPEKLESKQLYESIKIPYILVHRKSSVTDAVNIVKWDLNQTLTLDPDTNLYSPGHIWHELAQTFVNKPFCYYYDTIRHAQQLHLVNSSFYCMALVLKLDATLRVCYDRNNGSVNGDWTDLFNQTH